MVHPQPAAGDPGLTAWAGADVALATDWTTAHAMRDLPASAEKAYLLQRFEPDALPAGGHADWALDAQRVGYRFLAADPVLERRLADEMVPRPWPSNPARTW